MTAPPPPGWYHDPSGYPCERWFDGQRWTEYTRNFPTPPQQAQNSSGNGATTLVGVILFLVILFVIYAVFHAYEYHGCDVSPGLFEWPRGCL